MFISCFQHHGGELLQLGYNKANLKENKTENKVNKKSLLFPTSTHLHPPHPTSTHHTPHLCPTHFFATCWLTLRSPAQE